MSGDLRFARADTFVGPMLVAETDIGIAAISRSESLESFLASLRRRFRDAEPLPADLASGWIDEALSGGPLPAIDTSGLSGFDARVYHVVRSVRAGETVTYGEVAASIGSPGAARAVGGAMARCPLFPAVPCHRVVRAVDGWSGWGGDEALKRSLLDLERAISGAGAAAENSPMNATAKPAKPSLTSETGLVADDPPIQRS